eukprot:TRINITY_DN8245_c0_g1_i1.p1 TRINITY_DN8245_c0_g1~~TRINITY_DN8245_c0_g1_i1.p1  ORF type:complete len:626 (-),score=161.72 TRINITY_DN8245_c0_g1_i1:82-1959(-)
MLPTNKSSPATSGSTSDKHEKRKSKKRGKTQDLEQQEQDLEQQEPQEGSFRSVKPPLDERLLQVIDTHFGFQTMTPVQHAVLPLFLSYKDVAVEACTGSGKTLAFVLPIFQMLLRRESPPVGSDHKILALIILPTRELATQVHTVIQPFMGAMPDASLLLLIGGEDVQSDIDRFKQNGGSIVVATPGRLWDLMSRLNYMNFRELEVLIMDEADRLLDMGFEMTITSILQKLPKQRRTGLFSATLTEGVAELVRAGMRNPVKVSVKVEDISKGSQATPETLTNYYSIIPNENKFNQLVDFLKRYKDQKIIVYFLTCHCVEYFTKVLAIPKLKLPKIFHLHGQMKHKKRTSTLQDFSKHVGGILLATDLAARGLDIPDVNWVIQFDPPQDPKAYTHRIGRTARMGREGSAIVYLTPHEDTYIEFLRVRKVPMEPMNPRAVKENYLDYIKEAASKDREIHEKGQRAAVSYVRAYKEHHCNFIFKLKDLDLGSLFTGLGLLKAPKMPEIRGQVANFVPSDVDLSILKFADKNREKQRQKLVADRLEKAKAEKQAQSNKISERFKKSREPEETGMAKKRGKPTADSDSSDVSDDDDDINNEYKMIKKVSSTLLFLLGVYDDFLANVVQPP